MLSQRKNVNSFYMYRYAEHTGKWSYRTLSIRGNDLNAGWAYEEMILSLTEHTRKCLKVKYLGRIEYDFQKSRVTGPWDHKDSVSAKKVRKKNSCLCTVLLMKFNLTLIKVSSHSFFLYRYWYPSDNYFFIVKVFSVSLWECVLMINIQNSTVLTFVHAHGSIKSSWNRRYSG
jgi:hypothetical protein